mmetsp:Transcript_73037/g.145236  ORF Transcript_73037/g.145236 Transcript_73037/m.145236 type:complete len:231 (-) Transcript_73037:5633-6325(-)
MQVVTHLVDEHVPAIVARIGDASTLDNWTHIVNDVVHVLCGEEARDVAAREQIVHEHEEALVSDLHVGEYERDAFALEARLLVHNLQICFEVVNSIPRCDDHLEGREAVDKCGQSCERLLAHAADANHKRVTARRLNDARDATDVAHGVFEEHKVHRCVGLVVLVERAVEQLREVWEVGDAVIHLIANALRKVAEDKRLGEELRRGHFLEVLLGLLYGELFVLFEVADGH